MSEARDYLKDKVDQLVEAVRIEASRLIQTDGLTGLLNQRGLHLELDERVAGGDPFWCAFIELDKFKSINSRFGQTNGDGLLQEVAKALDKVAKQTESGAFRAHGDEFYLVGGGEEAKKAAEAAVSAIAALEARAHSHDAVMKVTASVGYVVVISADDDAIGRTDLLARTEQAVLHAKLNGRNQATQWAPHMAQTETKVEIRPECPSCSIKFSADLPRVAREHVNCPACGERVGLSEPDRLALLPA